MEEKKKLSVFALFKNIVALFFLIWSLFMPVEELGSMFIMHYSIILAVFSGAADDSTMVFGVFDMIYGSFGDLAHIRHRKHRRGAHGA